MSNGRHFLCQTVESDQIFDAIDELSEMTLWRIKNILLIKLVGIFLFGEWLLTRMSKTMSSARKDRVFNRQFPIKFYGKVLRGKKLGRKVSCVPKRVFYGCGQCPPDMRDLDGGIPPRYTPNLVQV